MTSITRSNEWKRTLAPQMASFAQKVQRPGQPRDVIMVE